MDLAEKEGRMARRSDSGHPSADSTVTEGQGDIPLCDPEKAWAGLDEGAVNSLYQSITWLEQGLRYLGNRNDARPLKLDGGKTIAPLFSRRLGGIKILQLIGTGASDYTGLVSSRSTAGAWESLAAALAAKQSWDLLYLSWALDAEAFRAGLWRRFARKVWVRPYEICPRISVDCSWSEFLSAKKKDFRKNVGRWERRTLALISLAPWSFARNEKIHGLLSRLLNIGDRRQWLA